MGRTLAEKIWADHVVHAGEGPEADLLYIDLHLVHEVTSPQAFDGLRLGGRQVRRPDLTVATEDHNVPTDPFGAQHTPGTIVGTEAIADPISRRQIEVMRQNA